MFQGLKRKLDEIRWEDAADPSRWVGFARRQVRLYFYILRELVRNRCPQQAAALTFTTLLSLVPLFAVAFSVFRGFAVLDSVEHRAEEAIFNSLLAGPLLSSRPSAVGEAEAGPAEDLESLTAEKMLAEAEASSRTENVERTLRLYLRLLELGAEPVRAREGMSSLRLTRAPRLESDVAGMGPSAWQAYLRAAGLPAGVPRRGGPVPAEARALYARALSLERRGDAEAALETAVLSEKAGYDPASTRALMADAQAALGDEAAGRGDEAAAARHYRAALCSYCDALMLTMRSGKREQASGLLRAHDEVLNKLGELMFRAARAKAEAYLALREEGTAGADEAAALQQALDELNAAARLLEHTSEVHHYTGKVLWAAGRYDEAQQEYETALEKSNEVAARGISMAVVDYIRMFVDKVGRAEIGVVGIIFLVITATSLLNTTERTLNHIWKVTERRPFWIKFTSFCTLLWLGPVLVGASVWARERLGDYVELKLSGLAVIGPLVGALSAVGQHAVPFLTTWLILVALYVFLPHTRVRFSSAAWGAFLGAILLHLAKPLFSLYVLKAVRYEKIYGSLGAVPLFLLWIWLLWLIVLFGAEVSFTIQNVGLLRYKDKLHRLSSMFIDRYLAARIMLYVAREFWETGRPVSAGRLAEILQTTPEEAADAAGRLVRLGFLTPVGEQRDAFHPARDLSRLKISEVLSITDRFRDESRSVRPEDRPYEEKLEEVFRAAIASQDEALGAMTFRDLLKACEEQHDGQPGVGEDGGGRA